MKAIFNWQELREILYTAHEAVQKHLSCQNIIAATLLRTFQMQIWISFENTSFWKGRRCAQSNHITAKLPEVRWKGKSPEPRIVSPKQDWAFLLCNKVPSPKRQERGKREKSTCSYTFIEGTPIFSIFQWRKGLEPILHTFLQPCTWMSIKEKRHRTHWSRSH